MSTHVLAFADVSFEIDANVGGRVTALRLGGRNLLTGPTSTPATSARRSGPARRRAGAGRPSPRSITPPTRRRRGRTRLTMRGADQRRAGLSVDKRFVVDPRDRAAAPDLSRFATGAASAVADRALADHAGGGGGLTFFPTGTGPSRRRTCGAAGAGRHLVRVRRRRGDRTPQAVRRRRRGVAGPRRRRHAAGEDVRRRRPLAAGPGRGADRDLRLAGAQLRRDRAARGLRDHRARRARRSGGSTGWWPSCRPTSSRRWAARSSSRYVRGLVAAAAAASDVG